MIIVYLAIVVVLLGVVIQASATLVTSISEFVAERARARDQLTNLLADLQARLAAVGLQVDLVNQAPQIVAQPPGLGARARRPAAVGRRRQHRHLRQHPDPRDPVDLHRPRPRGHRGLPLPAGAAGATCPRRACSRRASAGRSAASSAASWSWAWSSALFTAVVNIVFGLPYAGAHDGRGRRAPDDPVLRAVRVLDAAGAGGAAHAGRAGRSRLRSSWASRWFVTMNILQPRLMAGSVGIHPIIVLGSVVVGAKIAGIAGAIFGIPIAAVISALFFYWVGAVAGERDRRGPGDAARGGPRGTRGPAAAGARAGGGRGRRRGDRGARSCRRTRRRPPAEIAEAVDPSGVPSSSGGEAPA